MAGSKKPGKHTKKETDKVRDQVTVKYVKSANMWCTTTWAGATQRQSWSEEKPA